MIAVDLPSENLREQDRPYLQEVVKVVREVENLVGKYGFYVTNVFDSRSKGSHGQNPSQAVDLGYRSNPDAMYYLFHYIRLNYLDKFGVAICEKENNRHIHITVAPYHINRAWVEKTADEIVPYNDSFEPLLKEVYKVDPMTSIPIKQTALVMSSMAGQLSGLSAALIFIIFILGQK